LGGSATFGNLVIHTYTMKLAPEFKMEYNSLKSPITLCTNLALKAASSTHKKKIDVFKLKYETLIYQSHESPIPSF